MLDFFCFFLWCLELEELVLVDLSADGVVDAAGVSAANTGPAIRARAITGMSFLNIYVVSKVEECVARELPDRLMRASVPRTFTDEAGSPQRAAIMTGMHRSKCRMTTT